MILADDIVNSVELMAILTRSTVVAPITNSLLKTTLPNVTVSKNPSLRLKVHCSAANHVIVKKSPSCIMISVVVEAAPLLHSFLITKPLFALEIGSENLIIIEFFFIFGEVVHDLPVPMNTHHVFSLS